MSKKRILVEPALIYRLFYPQVPVIVCAKHDEKIAAMTANSVMSVSDRPAMISIAVNSKSRTGLIIRASGKFSINWLSYNAASTNVVIDLSK